MKYFCQKVRRALSYFSRFSKLFKKGALSLNPFIYITHRTFILIIFTVGFAAPAVSVIQTRRSKAVLSI